MSRTFVVTIEGDNGEIATFYDDEVPHLPVAGDELIIDEMLYSVKGRRWIISSEGSIGWVCKVIVGKPLAAANQ
jgi:hypothetical protein